MTKQYRVTPRTFSVIFEEPEVTDMIQKKLRDSPVPVPDGKGKLDVIQEAGVIRFLYTITEPLNELGQPK